MSVQAWPFAGPNREWGAREWRLMMSRMRNPGVIDNHEQELLVEPVASQLQSVVRPGMAWIGGHQVIVQSDETVAHPTADLEDPRVDLVVVTADWRDSERVGRVEVIEGTPATSPVAPSPTQDDLGDTEGMWQEPLFEVLIQAAAGETGGHTDVRQFSLSPQSDFYSTTEVDDLVDNATPDPEQTVRILATDAYAETDSGDDYPVGVTMFSATPTEWPTPLDGAGAGYIVNHKISDSRFRQEAGHFGGIRRFWRTWHVNDGWSAWAEVSPGHSSVEARVLTSETTTSTTFTDLATVGPTVTVRVGPSGLLKVTCSAQLRYSSSAATVSMDFELTGANSRSPSLFTALRNSLNGTVAADRTTLLTGLTPGNTTVRAKYATSTSVGEFANRIIIAQPL